MPSPLRILCADDDPGIRVLLRVTLERAGYTVALAEDGRAAAEKIAHQPTGYDLVITDTKMPHCSGAELVAKAQSLGYTGSFIVFGGAVSGEDRERFGALGVDYIIDKPAQDGELTTAVAEISARRSSGRA